MINASRINITALLIQIGLTTTFVHAIDTVREQQLIEHVKKSIVLAEQGTSQLSAPVLAVPGFTSSKVKHLLNNLCTLTNALYFEIGVWKGATFTAALYNNQYSIKQAVAIDNWSGYINQTEFENNCHTHLSNIPYQWHYHDSFTIDKTNLFNAPIDIYFYDGDHTADAQEKAFTYYDSCFASTFIAIVDDWNHEPARIGTRIAFEKLGYTILFEREFPAAYNGDLAQWWNGLYIAVIRRNS